LVCYEMIVWHKDLGFILFTYGVGEPIGLGIGMKVIIYLIIGFSLFLSGLLLYLRRRNRL